MIWWMEQGEEIDPVILPAIQAGAFITAKWPETKAKANELFPMAPSKRQSSAPVDFRIRQTIR